MGDRRSSVENLVINPRFWTAKRVFVTGHTGFKGAWLSLLLSQLGAKVYGYALAPESSDNLFVSAGVQGDVHNTIGDVCDLEALRKSLNEARPEIVIHMAAQSLVRRSYQLPVETYATNVMGTVHILEAARQNSAVQAVVVVTSDKCYENREWTWGYRESDRLGGRDPYSNSKSCAEMVTAAYRSSYFQTVSSAHIATARAGNVIGGGDWSSDRIVPDAMRAFIARSPLRIRSPSSVRPWQHVLDPLAGYLLLAERLVSEGKWVEEGWNFGPPINSEVPVSALVDAIVRCWGSGAMWECEETEPPLHEATYLKLDCSKARDRLGWRPLIDFERAIRFTVEWYHMYERGGNVRQTVLQQISWFLTALGIEPKM